MPGDLAQSWRSNAALIREEWGTTAARIVAQWSSGRLSDAEFKALLSQTVGVAASGSESLGDAIASGYLDKDLAGIVLPEGELSRLADASGTLLDAVDGPDNAVDRIGRFVVGEALHHFQDGARKAYKHHGVEGYRRGLSAKACELCVWLAKKDLDPQGYVYPISKPMHRHPGCTCTPIPATR